MPSDVIPYTNDVIEQHLETYGYIAGIRPIGDLQKIEYPVNE